MKTFFLSLFLAGATFAQTDITTFSFTKADCSPLSMLMLFPPFPGFTCTPSTTVVVAGDADAYEVMVEFTRANGMLAVEHTFLKSAKGTAQWVIYEEGVKIRKVTATAQAASLPVTKVF